MCAMPFSARAFNSSAWTRRQGELWTLLTFGRAQAGEQFDADGVTRPFIDGLEGDDVYRDESFYANLEYGIIDGVTAHFELPFKRVFVDQPSFLTNTQAFGNIYVGLRISLLEVGKIESPVAWSIEFGAFLPTGYTRNFSPSVGPGNVDFDLKTAVGYSFNITRYVPTYLQAGVGFRARTTAFGLSQIQDCETCIPEVDGPPNYSDEILYLGEIGITPFNGAVLLFGKTFGNVSVLEPTVGFLPNNPIPTRQRLYQLGGGIFVYPFRFFSVPYAENVGLAFQYYSTIAGRNVPRTDSLFVGLEYTHFF